jgi:hypothetical protein
MRFPQFIDVGGDERAAIFVAGSARSGTTWVGSVIAELTRSRSIFEPLILDDFQRLATVGCRYLGAGLQRHDRQLYISPELGERSVYYRDLKRILAGKINNDWANRDVIHGLFRRRVVKEIRANHVLEYLARAFPGLKIVWVVRDVLDVINSQLAMNRAKGWRLGIQYRIFSETGTLDSWLANAMARMNQASGEVEILAHKWCIETGFPLQRELTRFPNFFSIHYENLIRDPAAWPRLGRFLTGAAWSNEALAEATHRPSSTARDVAGDDEAREHGLDQLARDDIKIIRSIVDSYDLGLLSAEQA